jgi:hypothetical protein
MLNQWIPATTSMVAGRGMRRINSSPQRLRRRNVHVVDVRSLACTDVSVPCAASCGRTRPAGDYRARILQREQLRIGDDHHD